MQVVARLRVAGLRGRAVLAGSAIKGVGVPEGTTERGALSLYRKRVWGGNGGGNRNGVGRNDRYVVLFKRVFFGIDPGLGIGFSLHAGQVVSQNKLLDVHHKQLSLRLGGLLPLGRR